MKKKTGIFKYIQFIPIFICVIFSVFLYELIMAIEKSSHELRFEEKKQIVDLAAAELGRLPDSREFLAAIEGQQSGTLTVPNDDGEIAFYFHWVQDNYNANQYLLIAGVASDIECALYLKTQYFIAGILILVVIVNYVMIGVFRKKYAGDTNG